MGKIKKKKGDFEYLTDHNIPVAVVDVERAELIHLTPRVKALFGSETKNTDVQKWFDRFLSQKNHEPKAWLKKLNERGITTDEEVIGNKTYCISAQILNPNKANYLLLNFHISSDGRESLVDGKSMELVEDLPEGVVIHQDGKISYLNKKACKLFDVQGSKMLGKSFLSLFSGEVKSEMKKRLVHWRSREKTDYFEFSLTTNNGEKRYLSEQTVHIPLDGSEACQSIFTNLALRKQWIHEKMRAQLAEEINQILKHEIKEHKITQYELEQAKNLNLAIIESSLDMIIAENEEGKIRVFNKAAEKQFGYSRDEIIGQPSRILFKSDKEHQRVNKALKEKKNLAIEVENQRKNGDLFTSFMAASSLFTTDGKFLGSMGVSRDISEQKKAADDLQRSEELYRDLFDNMSDAYLLIDQKGKLTHWNKAGLELLGVSKKKAAEINLLNWIDKKDRRRVKEARKKMKDSGKTLKGQEYVLVNARGNERHVQVNSSPIFERGKFNGSRELLRDISDQKKALEQAESQSAKIRAIFESSAYMIWSVNRQEKLTSYNTNYAERFAKLSDKEPKIGLGALGISSKTTAKNKAFWKEKYAKVFSGKPQSFETIIPDEKGREQWYEVVLNPIDQKNGEIEELSGIAHSITFKKQAEGKIKEQAAKINSIFDSTAMLIWTLDTEFRITSYNANFAKMLMKSFGIEIQIGRSLLEMMNPFVRQDLRGELKTYYQRAMEGNYVQFEGPVKKKNDQIIWMETFLNPIFKEDGKVTEISCMAHEVTDKKIIEKQIRESLREKEILLQEVHHRVKNNLQVISSILNLQSSYVKDPNTLNILKESQNRIKSMSFIHESLYQTTDFSSIDFSDYILSLSKSLD